MKLAGLLSGNAPWVNKYQVAATNTVVGVPYLMPVLSDTDGVVLASTTAAANQVGCSVDAPGTRQTAQQSDASDPARYVSLVINANAVWRGRLCGGATTGTALAEFTNTAASTTGLLITAAFGTAYDDAYVWGATGANPGILRKIQGAVNTTGTPIVAFPNDIAVGDTFYACTFGPDMGAGVQLTTLLDEIDATGDAQSSDNFRCFGFQHKDKANNGATQSYALIVSFDHMLGGNAT